MLTAANLYDWETLLEAAFSAALVTAGFAAVVTTATAKNFQETRPRIELLFAVNQEKNPSVLIPDSAGVRRGGMYSGQLRCAIITASDGAGKASHADYRARVRAALGLNILPAINGVTLLNHKIHWIRMSGTTYHFAPDQGFETTLHTYDVDFSLNANSLAQFP